MLEVEDRALLVIARGVPHDLPVGETAALVAWRDRGPGRAGERAGIAFRRVALPERDGSDAGRPAILPLDDPDRVAPDTHVLRLVERASVNPLGAAVLPAPRGDLLAAEDVHADRHAPLADRAPPEGAPLPAVAAVPGRHPRDRPHLDAVEVVSQHDVERAANGGPAEGAEGVAAQDLDALDGRERQGIQVARGGRVGPAVDQNEERLAPGEEVAVDAGVEQLLERLGAGTLDEVPLVLGDDAGGGRKWAGMGRVRGQHGDDGKQSQKGLHRNSLPVSAIAIESLNPPPRNSRSAERKQNVAVPRCGRAPVRGVLGLSRAGCPRSEEATIAIRAVCAGWLEPGIGEDGGPGHQGVTSCEPCKACGTRGSRRASSVMGRRAGERNPDPSASSHGERSWQESI